MKKLFRSFIYMLILATSCAMPRANFNNNNLQLPESYLGSKDTLNTANKPLTNFYEDVYLRALIDSGIYHNRELKVFEQEISIAKNEIKSRHGDYLPFFNLRSSFGFDKVGQYTSRGASDNVNLIEPGKRFPEPFSDYLVAVNVSWELDIWKKLRNAKKAAVLKYLATIEGRNFLITQLSAEIASVYYELLALDNQLLIINRNIEIQKNALQIVTQEKMSAKVTELAVKRFEAELSKNQSKQFVLEQQIVIAENYLNFLIGRFPGPIQRNSISFFDINTDSLSIGIPDQLLQNRPDIKQAELNLMAAHVEVKSARAAFYPALRIVGSVGYNAYKPGLLFQSPESLLYGLAGDLFAPLINRNAIKAMYSSANARQTQALQLYEQTLIKAYIEVFNQQSNLEKLKKSYSLRVKQVEALNQSIQISGVLFKSARADYMEVLLTQRDALEARLELTETKKQQLISMVNLYKALGGGWR